jgi:hypothetical protein
MRYFFAMGFGGPACGPPYFRFRLSPFAACGTTHFQIEKQVRGSRTVTSVERLTESERVEEIGRMIAGATVTDTARATARDLMASAGARRDTGPTHAAKGERRKRK